jgi:hypothetical protein
MGYFDRLLKAEYFQEQHKFQQIGLQEKHSL